MRLFLTIIFLLLCKVSFAQVYQTSKNHRSNTCYLKISPDSSIIFIVETTNHTLYEESFGTIKHISDSTYLITSKVVFVQSIFENDQNEFSKFEINVGSNFPSFKDIETLTLKYDNGKNSILKTCKGAFITFYFDKKRYNKKHPFVDVYTNRKNPITKKLVYTKLFIRGSIDFSIGDGNNFQVVINRNTLKTIGEPPLESGSFVLKKVL